MNTSGIFRSIQTCLKIGFNILILNMYIFKIMFWSRPFLFTFAINFKKSIMKNKILIGIIAFAFLGFSSCKKDDSSSGSSTPSVSNLMTAKVNGVDWTSLGSQTSGSIINNVSACSGIAADSSRITFSVMQNVVANGTYDIGFGSGNIASYSSTATSIAWSSSGNNCTGTLTITSLNTSTKRMSGTFTFKGYRVSDNSYKDITVGVFTNVAYQTGSTGGVNAFTVKIDNVNWVPNLITGTMNNGEITIVASNTTGTKAINLLVPDNIAPGTYLLDGSGSEEAYYYASSSQIGVSISGSLNITSHNTTTKNIVGTFNFIAEDIILQTTTWNISNGTFNINY